MVCDLPEPSDLEGSEMPPVKEFLKTKQKNGKDLCAEEVYTETWKWLKERGCERWVSVQLMEQYAMSVARWVQCEEAISEYGMLAKHPTTKECDCFPVCVHVTAVHEAGQPDLVSDFPDREKKTVLWNGREIHRRMT